MGRSSAAKNNGASKVKGHLTTTALIGFTLVLLGAVVFLQLTVHDPDHVLLTLVGSWGLLSLPVGLLVGHAARGADADEDE